MNRPAKIIAPPYHVQSTAATLRDNFPYFPHHDSVSALWSDKWRVACVSGVYPFTEAKVEDFDPIFSDMVKISDDDPGILYRPDDYAKSFFPVAEQLVSQAEDASSKGHSDQAKDLFLRAAAVYRIARFPINRSTLSQRAWEKGKAAYEKGGHFVNAERSGADPVHAKQSVRGRSKCCNRGISSTAQRRPASGRVARPALCLRIGRL